MTYNDMEELNQFYALLKLDIQMDEIISLLGNSDVVTVESNNLIKVKRTPSYIGKIEYPHIELQKIAVTRTETRFVSGGGSPIRPYYAYGTAWKVLKRPSDEITQLAWDYAGRRCSLFAERRSSIGFEFKSEVRAKDREGVIDWEYKAAQLQRLGFIK